MTKAEPQKQPPVVNRSAPKATVVPILVYEDVAKAISWLNGTFGFIERLRAARPDGLVVYAQLLIGEESWQTSLQLSWSAAMRELRT
jgi:hypothetical protein